CCPPRCWTAHLRPRLARGRVDWRIGPLGLSRAAPALNRVPNVLALWISDPSTSSTGEDSSDVSLRAWPQLRDCFRLARTPSELFRASLPLPPVHTFLQPQDPDEHLPCSFRAGLREGSCLWIRAPGHARLRSPIRARYRARHA